MPDTLHRTRMGSSAGQPLSRRDGRLKVTGAATYAADNHPAGMAHAVMVGAAIGRGRVTHLDVAAAKAHPGVIDVLTPENRGKLHRDPDTFYPIFGFKVDVLQNDRVRYANQPIAVVVAETLEAAVEGGRLLAPQYEAETPRVGADTGERFAPEAVGIGAPPKVGTGDVEAGLAQAAHRVEVAVETPGQYHNAMEPHALVAEWQGDRLMLDMPNQAIHMARAGIAEWFDIPAENITLRSPFLGGGFGSKAILYGPLLLGILAARMVGRPVKLVVTRPQMFGPVSHRGPTWQRLRLGSDAEGRLTAVEHNTTAGTSSFDNFIEPSSGASRALYASPVIQTAVDGIRLDIGTPGPMRAPGLASGSAALEIAMDAAAEAAGMDPLAFRLANYSEVEPITGKPFSSKALRECYEQGSRAFGWEGRPLAPRSMRDADGFLTGWGMGSAAFHCPMFPAEARATLRDDGSALIETSGADMGQGAWTALAQIAAEALGLDPDRIEFRSGTSDEPDAGVAGGSGHTASAGLALHAAGEDAIAQLADLATNDPDSPLFGAGNTGVAARNGRLVRRDDESRGESYAEILLRAGRAELTGSGKGARSPQDAERYAMYSHGAVFAEVKVDPDLGQMRVTRLVGAFAAGRIINPKLARSQLYGGMIWGISFALHEEAVLDTRSGRHVSGDLAEYHVPVNADVTGLEVLLVDEEDRYVNPLGVKGVGEIGITGTVGAIANAIWHATGFRPHRYPIRVADLLRAGALDG